MLIDHPWMALFIAALMYHQLLDQCKTRVQYFIVYALLSWVLFCAIGTILYRIFANQNVWQHAF